MTINDIGDINIYKSGNLVNTNESYTNKRFIKDQRNNCYLGRSNNVGDALF